MGIFEKLWTLGLLFFRHSQDIFQTWKSNVSYAIEQEGWNFIRNSYFWGLFLKNNAQFYQNQKTLKKSAQENCHQCCNHRFALQISMYEKPKINLRINSPKEIAKPKNSPAVMKAQTMYWKFLFQWFLYHFSLTHDFSSIAMFYEL